MNETLFFEKNMVLKISLLNLGFTNKELKGVVDKKILKKSSKNSYLVLDKQTFQIIVLKKLLEFDRTILTEEELDFLDISDIDRKRMFAYGIAKKIDSERFIINDDINKIKLHRPEIDMVLYYKLYEEKLFNKNYILAREYLQKYIEICEAFNIEGDYYYKLTRINSNIEKGRLNSDDFDLYCNLRKKYSKLYGEKNYREALTVAYDFYKINPGSIEATMIAATRLTMNNRNYEKILLFLNEALNKDNTNPATYKYLGDTYFRMERYKESARALEKYISLDKNSNYDGYFSLFNSYLMSNDIKAAHKLFSDAFCIIPEQILKKFVSECIKTTKRCIRKELSLKNKNFSNLTELNNLKNTILKENSFDIDDFIKIQKEKERYNDLEKEIMDLLEPNESNIVETKLVDSYISNLDVSEEQKNLVLLRTSLILAHNNYFDKANSYIKIVERSKQKTNCVIEQLNKTRREMKLIKRKN